MNKNKNMSEVKQLNLNLDNSLKELTREDLEKLTGQLYQEKLQLIEQNRQMVGYLDSINVQKAELLLGALNLELFKTEAKKLKVEFLKTIGLNEPESKE